MPKQLFDAASAREAGKRSGKARRQQKLTLTQVEAELGSLETLEDAQRRLDKIGAPTRLQHRAGGVRVERMGQAAVSESTTEMHWMLRELLENGEVSLPDVDHRVGAAAPHPDDISLMCVLAAG